MALVLCPACSTPTHLGQDCAHCGTKAPRQDVQLKLGAALLGLGLATACTGTRDTGFPVEADYGVPDSGYLDADGDGYPASQDCDDDNDQVYPGAPETADDGVDSNCNDDDNT